MGRSLEDTQQISGNGQERMFNQGNPTNKGQATQLPSLQPISKTLSNFFENVTLPFP